MLMAKMNEGRRLPHARKITTIADYLRAMFSGVVAEPMPDAMEKLLKRIEPRVSSYETEA